MALTQAERMLIAELKWKKCSVEETIIVFQTPKTQQDKFQFLKWVVLEHPDPQTILDRVWDYIHDRGKLPCE